MPPITIVSPSATSTSLSASRVVMVGFWNTVLSKFALLRVARTFIITELSPVTCGVTASCSAASTNCTVATSCEPPCAATEPRVVNGMRWPLETIASLLLSVVTRGVPSVRARPLASAAVRITCRFVMLSAPTECRKKLNADVAASERICPFGPTVAPLVG